MFQLKVATPEFLIKAIKAGKEANFEGAIVLLLSGVGEKFKK